MRFEKTMVNKEGGFEMMERCNIALKYTTEKTVDFSKTVLFELIRNLLLRKTLVFSKISLAKVPKEYFMRSKYYFTNEFIICSFRFSFFY